MSLVAGWGINDFPMLSVWKSMLKRCYCPKHHAKHPTYIGCVVDERWHRSSNFEPWFEKHWVPGWQLDKDLIGNGMVYGPDTCVFVPPQLNSLFLDCGSARGQWPLGVCLRERKKRYDSQICVDGKSQHLGSFNTPEDAHRAYCKAKLNYCFAQADKYAKEPRLDKRVPIAIRRIAVERFSESASLAA